ncbi:hypothetical protein B9Z55_023743 [Caenorhabditis nigoni]|uniref:RDD domain-containing protein n=1 Tax=Caenorhabditis nigoni TaxID=1611254 RepID=A0A2G5SR02_9PELO|nr:hypothetical protein B9Z55_023743 [Caenorhabditis nigoni]
MLHGETRYARSRRIFRETFAVPDVTVDYGSMEAWANAHRVYLEKVRQQQQRQQLLEQQMQEQLRLQQQQANGGIQWVELVRTTVGNQQLNRVVPYPPPPPPPHVLGTVRFEAASFIRRFFAEVVDFLIVMFFKLCLLLALTESGIVDLNEYGGGYDEEQDVMQFIGLAQDLLPIEIICKVICCIFEGIFMAHGFLYIGVGQTPGKWLMGIRVISCHDVSEAEIPGYIDVHGPNVISLQQSMKRSFMKNVVVNSLFPLSTAAFQVHNGRVFYDVIVKTVVVVDL